MLFRSTVALSAEMLLLGRLAATREEAVARIEDAFASGAAAERFIHMIAALGGPADLLEHPERHFPRAPIVRPIFSDRPGLVEAIDTRGVGLAVVALGGGRTRPQDEIDHAVGITELAGLGDRVGPDRPLGIIHARSEAGFDAARIRLKSAYRRGETAVTRGPLIIPA